MSEARVTPVVQRAVIVLRAMERGVPFRLWGEEMELDEAGTHVGVRRSSSLNGEVLMAVPVTLQDFLEACAALDEGAVVALAAGNALARGR